MRHTYLFCFHSSSATSYYIKKKKITAISGRNLKTFIEVSFTSMATLQVSPRSPYGNIFLKIGLANAKDISKMDLSRELCRDTPTLIPSLVGGAGVSLHSSRLRSIFEMSLVLPEPIFKKKFP